MSPRTTSQGISPLWGSQAEREVDQFTRVSNTYQPRGVYVADGAQHGDVLAGIWQVGIINLAPLRCFVGELVNRPPCSIRGGYRQFGLHPIGDGRWVIGVQEAPRFIGLEVRIRPESGIRRLIHNSHIRT